MSKFGKGIPLILFAFFKKYTKIRELHGCFSKCIRYKVFAREKNLSAKAKKKIQKRYIQIFLELLV